MYKPTHNGGFKHKKRVMKPSALSAADGARPPENKPDFHINSTNYNDDPASDRIRDIERRVGRLTRGPQSNSTSAKPRKKRSVSRDRGRQMHTYSEDIEPMLVRQLQELTQRMDAMQSYGSVNNLNLSPRGKNQFLSKYGGSPDRNGYHSDGEMEQQVRSFPALPGNYGQPPMPLGGVGATSNGYLSDSGLRYPPPHVPSYDSSPYGRAKMPMSYQSERDDIRKSLTQQNMELQQALQDTRNEYLKAMTMLEGETYERQQLERKTGDLTNKLAASRQALAVTQTALHGLQDATEESGRTRDIRDIEIEKYLSEIKVKDSKIAALESRGKEFDDHMNMNMAKKDETIQRLQKKLTDALDTAYKAENDASTVSKDLSIAEQEVYSLRNRLTHLDMDHQETMKRMEKEYKHKIEGLNESLSKALAAQDNSEKNVLRSATLEAKNIELEARVRYLDSAILKTEREKNLKDQDIVKLQADMSALIHEKSLSSSSLTLELEDNIRHLEKNLITMKEREASLISERNNLQAEIDMYKRKVDELSDGASNPQITELEYAKNLLLKENDHLKRQQNALEQELVAVKKTLRSNDEQNQDSLKKQVSSKEDEIRQLYADLKVAKEDNATLTRAISENSTTLSDAAIQSITAENNNLSSANKKLEAELRDSSIRLGSMEAEARDASIRIVELDADLKSSSARKSELEQQLAAKTREAVQLERELEAKTADLTNLQTKINSNKFIAPSAPIPLEVPVIAEEPTPIALVSPEEVQAVAQSEELSQADESESKKKKKKKKKGNKSGKSGKGSKSSKTSAAGSDDEEEVMVNEEESQPVLIVPQPPIVEGESRQASAPSETGRSTPLRRAGFAVPTPEPETYSTSAGNRHSSSSNRDVSSAGDQPQPNPVSSSSNPPGNTTLNNIFNVTPSPAINSRKTLNSGDGRLINGSAGTDRTESAIEKTGYNSLRVENGNSQMASATSSVSAAEIRQDLAEHNMEKKRLKKGIGKWNTDFLLTHNREPGVEDKSSDEVITRLYENYHAICVMIKSKEEKLESMKLFN